LISYLEDLVSNHRITAFRENKWCCYCGFSWKSKRDWSKLCRV